MKLFPRPLMLLLLLLRGKSSGPHFLPRNSPWISTRRDPANTDQVDTSTRFPHSKAPRWLHRTFTSTDTLTLLQIKGKLDSGHQRHTHTQTHTPRVSLVAQRWVVFFPSFSYLGSIRPPARFRSPAIIIFREREKKSEGLVVVIVVIAAANATAGPAGWRRGPVPYVASSPHAQSNNLITFF